MFSFFKKQPTVSTFAALRVDMHSHLLPGIDDGAQTLADSMTLIKRLADLGFEELWTTPHVMADLYPNTPAVIQAKLAEVRTAVQAAGLTIRVNAAAEYLMDEAFGAKIEQGLLTLPGNRVLVEMSFVSPPPQLEQYLFQLQTKGYRVVLAHPERYLYYHGEITFFERLHTRGIELQVNLLSLTRHYGSLTTKNALQLLEAGLVDYLATDMHHANHAGKTAQMLTDKQSSQLLAKYLKSMKNHELADDLVKKSTN